MRCTSLLGAVILFSALPGYAITTDAPVPLPTLLQPGRTFTVDSFTFSNFSTHDLLTRDVDPIDPARILVSGTEINGLPALQFSSDQWTLSQLGSRTINVRFNATLLTPDEVIHTAGIDFTSFLTNPGANVYFTDGTPVNNPSNIFSPGQTIAIWPQVSSITIDARLGVGLLEEGFTAFVTPVSLFIEGASPTIPEPSSLLLLPLATAALAIRFRRPARL